MSENDCLPIWPKPGMAKLPAVLVDTSGQIDATDALQAYLDGRCRLVAMDGTELPNPLSVGANYKVSRALVIGGRK